MKQASNVLVVCAHPGDEVLGCGGTLALHAKRGDRVRVLVLGDGWTSRVRSLEKGAEALDLDVLESQARSGLAALGVTDVQYLRFPDNRFDRIAMLDLVKSIEAVKAAHRPDIVYTNSAYDLSVDQRKTCQAVITAFRPQPGERAIELLAFEVPSSTEWNPRGPVTFAPNVFVDIEAVLAAKIGAYKRFTHELRAWPHPRSPEAIENLAKHRGSTAGIGAAEAFVLLRSVRTPAARPW